MRMISGIVVLSVFLALSGQSFAQLWNDKAMPDSGIRIKSNNVCFAEIEKVITDSYGVDELADLGEDGVKLGIDLAIIYNQLIAGTLSLNTMNIEFNTIELEDWSNEIQSYKTRYLLSLNYNFTKDGVEYQKGVAFKYELADDGSAKPIFLAISEAEIDVMNPPIYYYFFEKDGVRFEDIW
ncbi:MAG: hypothetical protein PHQ54_03845 [Candidatus Omnitrophica bacterium]|nr:hypothetical protein [Candidatus Omnitrophota bacterium]